MKRLAILALSASILPLAGCPMTATQQQQVLKASDEAAIVVAGGQKAETAAFQQGLIPAAEHHFMEQQFASLGQIGKTVDSCVAASGSKGAMLTCLNTAITSVDAINANGGLFLKSTSAKNEYAAVMLGVRTVLASIDATLGGTPPAAPATTGGL